LDPETIAGFVVAEQPLPKVLPADFVTFWLNTWNIVYSSPESPLFTESRLQTGYVMTWLVLWFQTSGDVVGCNVPPSPNPPDTCGDNRGPPNWIDPTKLNPADCADPNDQTTCRPFQPQEPTPKHDPSVGEVICGIILTVAGVVATFLGGALVGIPAIIGGIALMVDGETELNWDEVDCQLYWLDVYMFNALSALHKLTVLAGVQHPNPADLSQMQETLTFGAGLPISYPSAGAMVKSAGLEKLLIPWPCGLLDWTQYPNGTAETPIARVWPFAGWWPNAVIDDEGTNPPNADITKEPASYDAGVQGSFGPSVQAALRLILNPPTSLPDWNLDGDRGLGWLTWELKTPYSLPLQTVAER
jgi:hypothetical protein